MNYDQPEPRLEDTFNSESEMHGHWQIQFTMKDLLLPIADQIAALYLTVDPAPRIAELLEDNRVNVLPIPVLSIIISYVAS